MLEGFHPIFGELQLVSGPVITIELYPYNNIWLFASDFRFAIALPKYFKWGGFHLLFPHGTFTLSGIDGVYPLDQRERNTRAYRALDRDEAILIKTPFDLHRIEPWNYLQGYHLTCPDLPFNYQDRSHPIHWNESHFRRLSGKLAPSQCPYNASIRCIISNTVGI